MYVTPGGVIRDFDEIPQLCADRSEAERSPALQAGNTGGFDSHTVHSGTVK